MKIPRLIMAIFTVFLLSACSVRNQPPGVVEPPTAEVPSTTPPAHNADQPNDVNSNPPVFSCNNTIDIVRSSLSSEWRDEASQFPCRQEWINEQEEVYLLIWFWALEEPEVWQVPLPYVKDLSEVQVAGGQETYLAQRYLVIPEKTGAGFWGPLQWGISLAGEYTGVSVYCSSVRSGYNREDGGMLQDHVDERCPTLLEGLDFGDLGRPLQPVTR